MWACDTKLFLYEKYSSKTVRLLNVQIKEELTFLKHIIKEKNSSKANGLVFEVE